ncbi:MAG: hypothetical protein R3C97_14905 [Geminicoccaceae bacterium]
MIEAAFMQTGRPALIIPYRRTHAAAGAGHHLLGRFAGSRARPA